jgi:hypothetical protein
MGCLKRQADAAVFLIIHTGVLKSPAAGSVRGFYWFYLKI